MKMLVAVVREKYVSNLLDRFLDENIMVTKVSSEGGFLKTSSVTLVLGVKDEEREKVDNIFREVTETENIDNGATQLRVSGASVFIVDLDKEIKI